MDNKTTKTIKRDWLTEAYSIAQGNKNIKIKKEHLKAAIECLVGFSREVEGLREVMQKAYVEACGRRKDLGLPIPPAPPSLSKKVTLPWRT